MGKLMSFGVCCMGISIWGVIQMTILGIMYKIEAVTLLEDAEADEFANPIEFIQKTEKNYAKLAVNCWLAAVLYVVMIVICVLIIRKAKKLAKIKKAKLENDDLMCIPPEIDDGVIVDANTKPSVRASIARTSISK